MSKLSKKVLSFFILGMVASGTAATINAASAGDLNQDSRINGDDVRILTEYFTGKSFQAANNADMNGDGTVNIIDVCLLKESVLNGNSDQDTLTDHGTAMDSTADLVADFRKGPTPSFFASDGWTNGDCFNCGWYEKNTEFKDGALNLTIDRDYTGKYAYSGAEYRTTDFYHYGYYETSMQAIKNDGVVSSFFTYTGPSDNNPWDEIDIEVLGKDTTKVQLNYYTNGVGNHEYMYDLGFDASEGYHTYGFDWQRDHITWYVDGKPVYTAYDNIPSTPGKIMMNTWPGITVDDWLKPFNGNTPLTARYQWVTFNKQ